MPQSQPRTKPGVWIARAILVSVVAWGTFAILVRPNLVPVRFSEVDAGKFYRSSATSRPAATDRTVARHGIKTIVDLVEPDADPAREQLAARTAQALGVRRLVFPVGSSDRPNPNAFVAAVRVLSDPTMQPVLVRCPDGQTRTGLCEDLYRAVSKGSPTPNLPEDLPGWSSQVLQALDERGWVPGFPDFETELARARSRESEPQR